MTDPPANITITPEPAVVRASAGTPSVSISERFAQQDIPGLFLQAVIIPGDVTQEGRLIEAVAVPWFKIIAMMQRDPNVICQLDWRQWEEIIAGAYKQQGFDVVLTPVAMIKTVM
jgi:hypothetical protein